MSCETTVLFFFSVFTFVTKWLMLLCMWCIVNKLDTFLSVVLFTLFLFLQLFFLFGELSIFIFYIRIFNTLICILYVLLVIVCYCRIVVMSLNLTRRGFLFNLLKKDTFWIFESNVYAVYTKYIQRHAVILLVLCYVICLRHISSYGIKSVHQICSKSSCFFLKS